MQNNSRNSMKEDFFSSFRKLNSQTDIDLEFFMLLKGNSFPKCTDMTISCHEIIFHISISTSPVCFHSYFG